MCAQVPRESFHSTANYTFGSSSPNSQTEPHNNNYKGGKKQPTQQNPSLLLILPNLIPQVCGLLPFPPNPNQIDPRQQSP